MVLAAISTSAVMRIAIEADAGWGDGISVHLAISQASSGAADVDPSEELHVNHITIRSWKPERSIEASPTAMHAS